MPGFKEIFNGQLLSRARAFMTSTGPVPGPGPASLAILASQHQPPAATSNPLSALKPRPKAARISPGSSQILPPRVEITLEWPNVLDGQPANINPDGQRPIPSSVANRNGRRTEVRPAGSEVALKTVAATTALNTLLGPGHPARPAVLTAASSVAALQAAVKSIALLVPYSGDRSALANEVQDAELLHQLLQLADHPGFGSAGFRLRRVLAEHPTAARTVPVLTPLIAANVALDTLLGVGHAARPAVLTAASSVTALQAAVQSIAVLAPNAGDRTALANEVQDAELLDQLLQSADHPGFGNAGLRLRSILDENPTAVRTVPGLTPLITAKAALDTLLGVGHPARPGVLTAASSVAALQAAVASIAVLAPNAGDRTALANEVQDAELLDQLLQLANHPDFGSAGLRLRSVLAENPAAARTVATLTPLIAAKKNLDHKILRGRLTTPLPDGVAPGTGHRDVIGGHSRRVTDTPQTFALARNVPNANTTSYASFRLVARGDAGGTAANVAANGPGNVIAAFQARVAAGIVWLNAPPAFTPNFTANAPVPLQTAATLQRNGALAAGLLAIGQFNGHVLAAQAAANALAVSGDPQHATLTAAFVDAVEDARASAVAILTATQTLLTTPGLAGVTAPDRMALTQARQGVAADFLAFETAGPVMSNLKNSTLGPAGMSEDDILALTDVVAATPATLFRHHPSGNAPTDGALVSTKHQLLHQGILWIATKDNVTYSNAPALALAGGSVSSSYPTQHVAVPPDPMSPAVDADGFTGAH
jgi:hypothetical protein